MVMLAAAIMLAAVSAAGAQPVPVSPAATAQPPAATPTAASSPAPTPSVGPAPTPADLTLAPVPPLVFFAPFSQALDDPLARFERERAAAAAAAQVPEITFRPRTDLYLSLDSPRALPSRVGQPVDLDLRHTGTVDIAPGVRLEGMYTAFDTLGNASLGRVEVRNPPTGQRGPAGGVDVLEARLHLEAAHVGPLTFDVLGGVRATTMDYLPAYQPEVAKLNIEPEPIVGASLRWDVVRRFSVVGTAVASATDPSGLTDLSVDARWHLGRAAELSVGYQMMRGTFEQQNVSGEVVRDLVVVQLKLSF